MKAHGNGSGPAALRRPGLALLAALVIAGCGGRGNVAAGGAGGGHAEEERAAHAAGEHGADEHGDEHGAEGVVELTPEAVRNARVRVGIAGPAVIEMTADAPGEVHLNAEQVVEIRPRYDGIVREIRKRIGDRVRAGEVVAVVQSNESLTDYEIASPVGGSVIARHGVTGQSTTRETVLLTVADLSSVWVDFAIYPQYVGRIRPGMRARIRAQNRPELTAAGTIHYIGPLLEQDTRVSSARVILANPDGQWQPGLFVAARVTLDRVRAPLTVPEDAVVRTAAGPAVFRAEGTRFELRPVTIGRSDGRTTEILSGLSAGDSVVVAQAFVLKSELGKGEVAHEH
jgi:membrane fusion protein, heavy metal efflux system